MKFDPNSVVDIIKSQLQNVLGSLTKNIAIQVIALVPIAIWSPYPFIAYSLTGLFILTNFFAKFWYSYFALKDPKLLGSEEHTREMTAMALGVVDGGNVKAIRERVVENLNDYLAVGNSPQSEEARQLIAHVETEKQDSSVKNSKDE